MRPSSLGGGRILRRTLSVCLSICLSVRPVIERHVAPPSELQWHTEGRISYGHLGRTNMLGLRQQLGYAEKLNNRGVCKTTQMAPWRPKHRQSTPIVLLTFLRLQYSPPLPLHTRSRIPSIWRWAEFVLSLLSRSSQPAGGQQQRLIGAETAVTQIVGWRDRSLINIHYQRSAPTCDDPHSVFDMAPAQAPCRPKTKIRRIAAILWCS